MQIGNKNFDFKNNVYIMGILNITPDSFSDGGCYNALDSSLRHVEKMITDGADIIDLGGESTRPGHKIVAEDEEIRRVIPIIKEIKKRFDIPLSIDTYKSNVGEMAINAGADLINDVWGFKRDLRLATITNNYQIPCILMHNRTNKNYSNLIEDIKNDLHDSITIAKHAGIPNDKIILDPGIGFAKTYEQNLKVMAHLDDLKNLGYPLLLGTSRKSMIGLALDLPVSKRVEGTLATTVMGIINGASIIRVHDVLENKRVAQMTTTILKEL